MSVDTARFVVRSIAQTVVDNEDYFGELDAVVGDGDFGFSLARGFENVLADLDGYPDDSVSALLTAAAMTISKRVGGTSGPIWGTAFLRAAMAAKGVGDVGPQTVLSMLRQAIDGVMARGEAQVGEKTLLDALVPAADEWEAALADGDVPARVLERFATRMREAAEATRALQAMRGRASYSGARSIGSPDAGAVALAVIAERLHGEWSQRDGARCGKEAQ